MWHILEKWNKEKYQEVLWLSPVAILRSIMVGIQDFNGANEPENRCGNAIESKMLVGVFDTMEEVVQVFCDCGMEDWDGALVMLSGFS